MNATSIQTVSTIEDGIERLRVFIYASDSNGLIDSIKEYLSGLISEYDRKEEVYSVVHLIVALTPEIREVKVKVENELGEALDTYNAFVKKMGKGPNKDSSFSFTYSLEEDRPIELPTEEIEKNTKPRLANILLSIPFFLIGAAFIGGALWTGVARLLAGFEWLEDDALIIGAAIVLAIFGGGFLQFGKDALYKGHSEKSKPLVGPVLYYIVGALILLPGVWSFLAGSQQALIVSLVGAASIVHGVRLSFRAKAQAVTIKSFSNP